MNKKYGFIFLGLGIIFMMLFVLYSYTNLFTGKSTNNDKPGDIINYKKDDFNYDFVKLRNTNTKISFPIDKSLKKDYGDDYHKLYKNNNSSSLEVMINSTNVLVENYIDEVYNSFKTKYNQYRVKKNSIKCNYTCERYKVYKDDNSLLVDELRLLINFSSKENFELKYHFESKELTNEFIDFIVKNIDFINDTTYTIGRVINNELCIDFERINDYAISFSLDSNIYEEVIDSNNNMYSTTIKNKNTNSIMEISIITKEPNETFDSKINKLYNEQEKNILPISKDVYNYRFYKYVFDKHLVYAYIIDDNSAMLIDSKDGEININDFSRIVIIDG